MLLEDESSNLFNPCIAIARCTKLLKKIFYLFKEQKYLLCKSTRASETLSCSAVFKHLLRHRWKNTPLGVFIICASSKKRKLRRACRTAQLLWAQFSLPRQSLRGNGSCIFTAFVSFLKIPLLPKFLIGQATICSGAHSGGCCHCQHSLWPSFPPIMAVSSLN